MTFVFAGLVVAYLYGRKTRNFLWHEYFIMLSAPFISTVVLVYLYGIKVIIIFIVGAIGFTLLEWLLGFFYHKTMGAHLWIYERYTLPGRYTSYLGLPFWGFGAVLMWLIFRNF